MYLMIYWLEVITSSGRARYMHYNRGPNIFPLCPPQLSQLAFYHNDRHFSVVFFSSFSSAFCKTVCRDSCLMFPSTSARGRSSHMIKTRKKKSPFPISLHSWLERRSLSCPFSVYARRFETTQGCGPILSVFSSLGFFRGSQWGDRFYG